jgi:hypothetical protein
MIVNGTFWGFFPIAVYSWTTLLTWLHTEFFFSSSQWRSPGVYQTKLPWKAKLPVFMRGVAEAVHEGIEVEPVSLENIEGSAALKKVQSILGKRGRE